MLTSKELREIASRLLHMADDMDFQANPVRCEGGAVKVTLPRPDLFSALERGEIESVEINTPSAQGEPQTESIDGGPEQPYEPEVKPRTYQRVGCKMKDESVKAAQKVGRAQGYCQRSDIERSLRRDFQYRSREEIREAVNKAVAALGLTCIVYNSYRYYRRSDRNRILEAAMQNFVPYGAE